MATSIIETELESEPESIQTLNAPLLVDSHRRRFSSEEYLRMAEIGVLKPNEKTELINGEVRTMLPSGRLHWLMIAQLDTLFHQCLPTDQWTIICQATFELDEDRPEPDLVVVRGRASNFHHRNPSIDEVVIMIEVAETSLHYDRGEKLRLYAAAGIEKYWIINLVDSQIETYSGPMPATENSPANYRTRRIILKNEVAEIAFTESLKLSFQLADLLPAPPAT